MSLRDRLAAWIYTGPLGHLYGTVADVVSLWTGYMASRARHRLARGD